MRHRHGKQRGKHRKRVRGRLHRRLFWWFGASILLITIVVGLVVKIARPEAGWMRDLERGRTLAVHRFERHWDDPAARKQLADDIANDLELGVTVESASHDVLSRSGGRCFSPELSTAITRDGEILGYVRACRSKPWHGPFAFFLGLFAAAVTVWGATGWISRRLTRPLRDLGRVAGEIGDGKLSSRAQLGTHHSGEVGELADSINDMAKRIEKQLADQRELLAGVSHEIRTPLARMRVLIEMLRDAGTPAKKLDQLEEEVLEIDHLVGQLLASSRLDFAAMTWHELDAGDVAARALERASLEAGLLDDQSGGARFEGDATLIARALSNLLDNAKNYGRGPTGLTVTAGDGKVRFVVDDSGSGFSEHVLPRAFDAFQRAESSQGDDDEAAPSLGLGLALVRRIAAAHGGTAWAENRPEGGARVGFDVAERRKSAHD